MAEEKQAASVKISADKKDTVSQEELKQKLEECEKKTAEYLASWQRERAGFLNYKKEELERVGQLIKYADIGIILKILPILDNFEIVEKKLPENLKNNDSFKGILQIKNQISELLKNQGVEEIKSIGEKFNPNFHEVVEEIEPASAEASAWQGREGKKMEPGIIIEEIQKGYKINGRLLRPARVKVVK